ncbi:30478_t:CDS:2, partial [Gigaspora margarita]
MEVLVEHDRLKNWEKLKEREVKKLSNQRSSEKKATWFQSIENITLENSNTQKKRSKHEWVIVDENKENQPIIGKVMTKRTHITDIICYESSSRNEKQTGERSSNKVLQERLSNGVKRARTEKLINISPWVKYTKREMNLQLEPDYFVKREKGNSISSEQVRSLQNRKEKIRVIIEEPSLNERADRIAKEEGEVDVPTRVKWVMTKSMIFWPVWKGIEIECSPREFIKQLLTTATRAEWTFNQGLYNEIHQKRVSQKNWKPFFALMKRHSKLQSKSRKENINIKEELSQKDKIALGLDKLREVLIPRDIKEYEEQHIEWSKGFLADKIGSSLERMN